MSRALFLLFAVTLAPKFIAAQSLINLPQTVEQEISAFNASSYRVELVKPTKPLAIEGQSAPGRKTSLKLVLLMSGLTYAAAGLDMHTTYTRVQIDRTCPLCYSHPFREYDPLAKPFIHLPSPAYYAAGFAVATGVNFLGWKMSRSKRWHRVWFIPQSLSIGGNCWGISTFH
jgi:hypothetical protein